MGSPSQRKLAQSFFDLNIEVTRGYDKKNSAINFNWFCF